MLKWLLVIVVVAAVYFFFIKKKPLPNETQAKGKKDNVNDDADMVACKTCGTYIALNEALLQNGEYFCSDECRKA